MEHKKKPALISYFILKICLTIEPLKVHAHWSFLAICFLQVTKLSNTSSYLHVEPVPGTMMELEISLNYESTESKINRFGLEFEEKSKFESERKFDREI